MTTNQDRATEVIGAWIDDNLPHDETNFGADEGIAQALADAGLLTPDPKPRTLADMTPEEHRACQWMQADHVEHGRVIITHVGNQYVYYMKPSGLSGGFTPNAGDRITPLPDLPRLEWPASEPATEDTPESEPEQEANCLETLNSSPQPEDVPGDEPWIVDFRGERYVSRLVPEVKA